MKSGLILFLSFSVLLLASCTTEEARVPEQKYLFIISDRLTKEDSLIINQFSFDRHVHIEKKVLSPKEILHLIRSNRFNPDIDILLTEDDMLREQLENLKAFRSIRDQALYGSIDRQFNNQHHLWIAVSHDPLIVTCSRDTSGNCADIPFRSWHRNDSLKPAFFPRGYSVAYQHLLKDNTHLKRLLLTTGGERSEEQVYPLSVFVEIQNSRDSLFNVRKTACRHYLIDHQRFVSRKNTASVYRYGRNPATAEQFIRYYLGNDYQIASGRNQLPTRKNVPANWYIRTLNIR